MSDLEQMLKDEKMRLEEQQAKIHAKISTAQRELQGISARLVHINALLGHNEATPQKSKALAGSAKLNLADLAAEILAEREREPMYYKDLAEEVQARGGDLVGTSPGQILVARLVNDSRFIRPVRKGYYALRQDYPNARNVGARRRRRRPN